MVLPRDSFVVALTLGTGALDALGFSRLGNVFASVMTGNLVLLGLSISERTYNDALHLALAVLAFGVGVLVGSRIAGHRRDEDPPWPASMTRAITAELVVVCLFAVGWELGGAHPTGPIQTPLLLLAALAMGIQSGTIQGLGVSGMSTTYMTGTLTALLSSLMVRRRVEWRSAAVLSALVVGALVASALDLMAAPTAPLVPVAALAFVVVVGRTTR